MLALIKKAEIDPNVVLETIKSGSDVSVILNVKSFMLIAGDVVPRFRIGIYQKDLHKTLLTGKDLGVLLPMNRLVQQMLRWLINDGKRDLNHSAIANFIEDMANEAVVDR